MHTAALVGVEVGALLGKVGMSEILERMRICQVFALAPFLVALTSCRARRVGFPELR